MVEITSSSNPKIKYIKSLSQKKQREKNGEYTVEGKKSVSDALNSCAAVTALYLSFSFMDKEDFEYPENIPVYRVADEVFEKACDTKAPQGIIAVLKMENAEFELDLRRAYVYCDGINDPGNLGTIIRTADAAGFGGVMLSEGCADLYNPKTVRASMGSFFKTHVMQSVNAEKLSEYKERGFSLIGGTLSDSSIDYREADMSGAVIIIVGNEANGISDEVLKICSHVKIPILGGAESLNAGVAAALLMYEYVRRHNE